jgi:6,7-dimethyl-8-ribityllumazine synthase
MKEKMSGKAVRAIKRLSNKTSEYGMIWMNGTHEVPTAKRTLCKRNF